MKRYVLLLLLLAFGLFAAPQTISAQRANADEKALRAKIELLLDAYGKKDAARLVSLFDEKDVLMMGTDASEVADTKAEVEKLLSDDFQLWKTSEFGEFVNFYAAFSGKTATAFFDVPWQAQLPNGETRSFLIRFASGWRKKGGEWKLLQIMNSVPTVGQSAAEILKKMPN